MTEKDPDTSQLSGSVFVNKKLKGGIQIRIIPVPTVLYGSSITAGYYTYIHPVIIQKAAVYKFSAIALLTPGQDKKRRHKSTNTVTCSNLVAKAGDHVPRGEGLEREVVVAGVGEPVAVIADPTLIGEQAVLAHLLQQLVHTPVTQVRNLRYQRTRH